MSVRFCDEQPFGFGWIHSEPAFMERASHALAVDGRVYLFDPVDDPAVDARIRALGEPAGVVQLLDRHDRDSQALAAGYGVPLHRLPDQVVPGTPLQVIDVVDLPVWRERAIWWPERRLLLVPESVGSAAYYRAPGERVAAHPMRRLLAPRGLAGFEPEHLLFGHGEGLHAGAAEALSRAVTGAPRTTPAWVAARVRGLRKR